MNVWEKIYQKGELLTLEPHPDVKKIADIFIKENVKRILDVGSGGGRHITYFAGRGFDVYGLDVSHTALQYTLGSLAENTLTAHLTLHDMVVLPYDTGYFDAVISVQVIHHNTLKNITKTIKEVSRY
ncbi:MAG: class I SAM-dependent methyltransferase [Candidatus Methanofastidiosia archaeon]|jgi:2-polyprenyl-3-methyl-5-hydroxy-6-metoxy-1,4-benzoquinol methylase